MDKIDSAVGYMLSPSNGFFGAYRGAELIGFCSIGTDGQVPGGAYDDSAVDLGAGMRPDWVGTGNGISFLKATVAFAESRLEQGTLRATIASWNQRAIRAAQAVGFVQRSSFRNPRGTQFTILIRVATKS
jgi:RimJ/RimL family protein N-acetyltransferase